MLRTSLRGGALRGAAASGGAASEAATSGAAASAECARKPPRLRRRGASAAAAPRARAGARGCQRRVRVAARPAVRPHREAAARGLARARRSPRDRHGAWRGASRRAVPGERQRIARARSSSASVALHARAVARRVRTRRRAHRILVQRPSRLTRAVRTARVAPRARACAGVDARDHTQRARVRRLGGRRAARRRRSPCGARRRPFDPRRFRPPRWRAVAPAIRRPSVGICRRGVIDARRRVVIDWSPSASRDVYAEITMARRCGSAVGAPPRHASTRARSPREPRVLLHGDRARLTSIASCAPRGSRRRYTHPSGLGEALEPKARAEACVIGASPRRQHSRARELGQAAQLVMSAARVRREAALDDHRLHSIAECRARRRRLRASAPARSPRPIRPAAPFGESPPPPAPPRRRRRRSPPGSPPRSARRRRAARGVAADRPPFAPSRGRRGAVDSRRRPPRRSRLARRAGPPAPRMTSPVAARSQRAADARACAADGGGVATSVSAICANGCLAARGEARSRRSRALKDPPPCLSRAAELRCAPRARLPAARTCGLRAPHRSARGPEPPRRAGARGARRRSRRCRSRRRRQAPELADRRAPLVGDRVPAAGPTSRTASGSARVGGRRRRRCSPGAARVRAGRSRSSGASRRVARLTRDVGLDARRLAARRAARAEPRRRRPRARRRQRRA